jgi:hypothetical protein
MISNSVISNEPSKANLRGGIMVCAEELSLGGVILK